MRNVGGVMQHDPINNHLVDAISPVRLAAARGRFSNSSVACEKCQSECVAGVKWAF